MTQSFEIVLCRVVPKSIGRSHARIYEKPIELPNIVCVLIWNGWIGGMPACDMELGGFTIPQSTRTVSPQYPQSVPTAPHTNPNNAPTVAHSTPTVLSQSPHSAVTFVTIWAFSSNSKQLAPKHHCKKRLFFYRKFVKIYIFGDCVFVPMTITHKSHCKKRSFFYRKFVKIYIFGDCRFSSFCACPATFPH